MRPTCCKKQPRQCNPWPAELVASTVKQRPQIRLRTFFLIFFCAAVGLTIGANSEYSSRLPWYSRYYVLDLDWHYALLSAASVAIVFGLVEQAVKLWRSNVEPTADVDLAFALTFAIAWRIAIAASIILCLVTTLLLMRRIIELPDSEMYLAYEVFPFAVWICCIIVVLMANLASFGGPGKCPERSSLTFLPLLLVVLVVLLMMPDLGLIHYLVHIATAGIEQAQRGVYHRPGVFSNQAEEGFRLFWITTAAVGLTFVSLACLAIASGATAAQNVRKRIGVLSFAVLTLLVAAYVSWYYGFEVYRVSPDLAGVGLASSQVERIAGICIAGILLAGGAYRLAVRYDAPAISDHAALVVPAAANAVILVYIPLVIGIGIYIIESVRTHLRVPNSFWLGSKMPRIVEATVSLLQNPSSILILLVGALSVRLCWLSWRKPTNGGHPLLPLSQRRFVGSFFALAIWLIVAVPTISSYCFVFWLGPWYLYGP
jgi:hypothetical protein